MENNGQNRKTGTRLRKIGTRHIYASLNLRQWGDKKTEIEKELKERGLLEE